MTRNTLHATNDNWTPCACGSELALSDPTGWTCTVCEAPRHNVNGPVSVRLDDVAASTRSIRGRRAKTGRAISASALMALVLLGGCQTAFRPNSSPPIARYNPPSAPPPLRNLPPPNPPVAAAPANDDDGSLIDPAGLAVAAATTGGAYLLLNRKSAQAATGMTPPSPAPGPASRPAPNVIAGPRAAAVTNEAEAGAVAATETRAAGGIISRIMANPVTRALAGAGEGATVGEGVALGIARRFIVPIIGGVVVYELVKPKEH